jgi:hypothetical protein
MKKHQIMSQSSKIATPAVSSDEETITKFNKEAFEKY